MDKIFEYVDRNFDRMLEELQGFCSLRSVAGDENGLRQTREWIIKKLGLIGVEGNQHPVDGGNAVITAHVPGAKGKAALLFYNHYDVVHEGNHELWSAHPFRPEIRGSYLYGRGVSDNKGPLLSRLQAVEAILAVKGSLPAGVRFFLEGDEETSSPSLRKFCENEPETFRQLTDAEVCLWENGRRDDCGRPWVRFGVRGSISFDLSVETSRKDVHARLGTVIPSASWRLIWALASLKGEDERIAIDGFYDDVMPVTAADEEILQAFPYEEASIKKEMGIPSFLRNATGVQLKKQLYMEPSLSVCGLEAGELYKGARGIVPHKASAKISFYLVANQTPEKVEAQLRAHLKKHGFHDISVRARGANTPVRTPINFPLLDIVTKAAAYAYKEPLVIEPTQLGGGPAIYFHRAWPAMPIIGIGPGNTNGNHHAPEENIGLEDYRASIKHTIALIYELSKHPAIS